MPLLKAKAKSMRSWKAMVQGWFPFDWKNGWEFSAKRNNTPVKARKREYLEGYCLFSENLPPGWTVSFEFSPELPKIPVKGKRPIYSVLFSRSKINTSCLKPHLHEQFLYGTFYVAIFICPCRWWKMTNFYVTNAFAEKLARWFLCGK